MSYQVLARKWRPQIFAQLMGQSHVVTALSNALTNERLHHAYLFTGTRGVGKTTIARIFAKSLNCADGVTAEPCGHCQNCTSIEQGRFVDLVEVDAASRTKVEDTREILDNVQYSPTQGRYKVYLIDEVHMLSRNSFNALLKTLEEPPPHVKFLLATTDPQKLPVTILSRCLQFSLKALTVEQIETQLNKVLEAETINKETGAINQLAVAADGSMRDALSLTDQAIAQGDGQVLTDVVRNMLGMLDEQHIESLLIALLNSDFSAVMASLSNMAAAAIEPDQVLTELLNSFHQMAMLQVMPNYQVTPSAMQHTLQQMSQQINAEQLQLYYQIGIKGRKDLPHAANPKAGLEMTMLRLLAFTPATGQPKAVFNSEQGSQPVIQSRLTTESNQAAAITNPPESSVVTPQVGNEPAPEASTQAQTSSVPQQASAEPQSASENVPVEQNGNESEQHLPSNPNFQTTPNEEVVEPSIVTSSQNQQSDNQANSIPSSAMVQGDVDEQALHAQQAQIESLAQSQGYAPTQRAVEPELADNMAASQQFEAPPVQPPEAEYYPAPQHDLSSYDEPPITTQTTDEHESIEQPSVSSADMLSSFTKGLAGIKARKEALDKQEQQATQSAAVKAPAVPSLSKPQTNNEADSFLNTPAVAATQPMSSTNIQPFGEDAEQNEQGNHEEAAPWVDEFSGNLFDDAPISSVPQPASQSLSPQSEVQQPPEPQHAQQTSELASEAAQQPMSTPKEQPSIASGIPAEVNQQAMQPIEDIQSLDIADKVREDGIRKAAQINGWAELIDRFGIQALQRQFALHSTLLREDQQVTLKLDAMQKHLDTPNNRAQLQAMFEQFWQMPVNLDVQIIEQGQATPFAIQKQIEAQRLEFAKEQINQDQNVQALLQAFDGSINQDSIKAI